MSLFVYYTIGNHETDRHQLDEILVFYDMKSPFYSFELENYKFIVLNTCFYSKDGVEEVFYENNYKVFKRLYRCNKKNFKLLNAMSVRRG